MSDLKAISHKKKKKKKKKVVKTNEQILQERRQKRLTTKVRGMFKNMGFDFVKTDGIYREYGGQGGELDNIFVYENIVLMVEETISNHDASHLRTKNYFYSKIKEEFSYFLSWLKEDFSDVFNKFDSYAVKHYKFFYLYATDNIVDLDLKNNFKELIFIDNKILEYFSSVSSSIKYTAKYELFKFLKLDVAEIGNPDSGTQLTKIETAVIMPDIASGFPDGVQVVTFVMKAKHLMECAYVLRKDSWDNSNGLYQRLLDKKKLENIRKFLFAKQRTFIDSIIITLPFDTTFSEKSGPSQSGKEIDIFNTTNISNISMTVPYKINTIGIIDGQHRVYSHYESSDSLESEISKLRNKRHLFVTGLFFDRAKFDDIKRRKLEGEIFLQINNEQKKVNKALLQYIKSLSDPFSTVGIGNNVINYLNSTRPFLGMFSDSALTAGGIKTPSILQYGLQLVVGLDENTNTLYKYWLKQGGSIVDNENILKDYIDFCGKSLSNYFCAVRDKYTSEWKAKTPKGGILTSTMIVGFIRAYRTSLEKYDGPQDFAFYKGKFNNLNVDFSLYISSHWNALATKIDELCWT